jgi:cyclophilin family peptidyl-prolyl cis-trans isomerase
MHITTMGSRLLATAMLLTIGCHAAKKEGPMVEITTTLGTIRLELYEKEAPITVRNFLEYVRAGYYDGTVFHRVIPNFMIQGGGLDADLRDKRGERAPIKNESANGLKNDVGTVAMARTSAPDSATSQFFINVRANAFLDRDRAQDGVGYAVFGRVADGMDVVRAIERVKTTSKGMHDDVPTETVVIQSVRVVE